MPDNQPVLIYADMPYLPYMSLDPDSHFGGHAVVLFGYDDEQGCFYVSDRDNPDFPVRTPGGMIAENYHMVSYEQMELARSSAFRPFPANNKYIMFDFSNFKNADNAGIRQAIMAVCDKMLNPQARLKGICGIEKFGKEIIKWGSFDVAKLRTAAITNYFQISADGGTGGGIFRKMYGGFCLRRQNCLITAISGRLAHASLKLQRSGILWQMNCGRCLKMGIAVSCSIYLKKSGRCMTRNMIYTAS